MQRLHPAIFNRSTAAAGVVRSLSPAAWYRYGIGITVTGSGVSQWADQSGNDRHLTQGTDASRPAPQSDGSILFDGVDDYLKADPFTLNQPETVYILYKTTWANNAYVFDGNANNLGALNQTNFSVAPNVRIYASGASPAVDGTGPPNGVYGVQACVFNGAGSVLQLNHETAATGDVGASNMGGFTLGKAGIASIYSNITVKEVILFPAAHDAATRASVIRHLMVVGRI